jgi:hypothetical protein
MVHRSETGREGLHRFVISHIASGDEIGVGIPVKAPHLAALGEEAFGNGTANASGGSNDGDGLFLQVKIHAGEVGRMQARIATMSRAFRENFLRLAA